MTSIRYSDLTQDHVLIDVREEFEYQTGCIPGSINKPLSQLTKLTLPDGALVFVCQNERRAEDAIRLLQTDGSGRAYSTLREGLTRYIEDGWPLIKARRGLPLIRQAQISIGCLLILGALGGLAFLAPMIGFGLVIAGATGHCGMVSILRWMPWNQTRH
ncbi:MAG: rhodanese-like domain-containing protein [Synechococcus sp.]